MHEISRKSLHDSLDSLSHLGMVVAYECAVGAIGNDEAHGESVVTHERT